MSRVQVSIQTNQLSAEEKEQMWSLYHRYYHYSHASFMARTETNTHYAFYHAAGKLVGFTGLRINEIEVAGKNHLFIYFGQTVVDKAHRGKSLLHATAVKLVLRYAHTILTGKAYWWADALTYRAYLAFAKGTQEYYPNRHASTPCAVKRLMDELGRMHYGQAYQLSTGIVAKPEKYVNDHSVEIRLEDLKDPDIAFYQAANPNHVVGNGLLTMAPVSTRNLLFLLKRLALRPFRNHA